jgi:hypothetical protein
MVSLWHESLILLSFFFFYIIQYPQVLGGSTVEGLNIVRTLVTRPHKPAHESHTLLGNATDALQI